MNSMVPRRGRRVRVGTVIWGATLLAVGLLILVGEVGSISLDPVIVALGLLLGVGVSLIIGGLLSIRARPQTEGEDLRTAPPS